MRHTYNKYDADLYGKYVDEYNVKTHMTRENKSVFQCPYKMSVQMSIISAIKTRGKSSRKPQAEETCKERVIGRDWMSEKGGLKQAKERRRSRRLETRVCVGLETLRRCDAPVNEEVEEPRGGRRDEEKRAGK